MTPRSEKPVFEPPKGMVSPEMTTGLMGPLKGGQNLFAGCDNVIFIPEIVLVLFALLLADQDRLETLLKVFVDIPKLLHVPSLLKPIQGFCHSHVQVEVHIHTGGSLLC